MNIVIRSEAVGKKVFVGQREQFVPTLRDAIANTVSAPFRWASSRGATTDDPLEKHALWALKDVSFEVGYGDIVGIIGRNGSGKSTLLKILARITEPTTGRALVRGRVGALLEVGTGFHHELTGRENVFINGAILGMRRREIQKKFDEIVAFAEVERFIDTPVKRYSSGMQMRLAFAVAAHLDPTILLVDEVLAVGDIAFQQRCLGKMQEVSRQGRTVILVSHQMGQIRRLCDWTIWLDQGRVRSMGPTAETIRDYEFVMASGEDAAANQCFTKWEIRGGGHTLREADRPFVIRAEMHLRDAISMGHLGLAVLDEEDRVLAGWAFEPISMPAGRQHLDITIDALPLLPRNYRLSFTLFDSGNNLTGGRLIEKWIASPHLLIDTPPVGHPQDEWAGVLNIPASLDLAHDRVPSSRHDDLVVERA